ncbi:MAG: DUF3810 domain-containing protein [Clostridiales bacterium]|nr:DUF3810 domain-containing protein [Clostridiales bacterium]
MEKLNSFLHIHKRIYFFIAVMSVLNALFYLLRPVKPIMTFIAETTLGIRVTVAAVFDLLPFSVAEVIILLSIAAVLFYLIKTVVGIIQSPGKGTFIIKRFSFAVAAVLFVVLLFNLFLGASYYGTDFLDKSGISVEPTTIDKLYNTTKYFALKLSETSGNVKRDEHGVFSESVDDIFRRSSSIYDNSVERFPFLEFRTNRPKKLLLSKLFSCLSYTGFYFPFTGEANINIDSPGCFMPSTIAHEMAHQRGIAYEQEANFVAIYVSINSGDPIYEYSGYLLAYVHLNNALYKYDKQKYYEVYGLLNDEVKADLSYNNKYWERFEGPVSEVTDAVYDTFLKSYGQELGIQSYGAVVDLLIAFYGESGRRSSI